MWPYQTGGGGNVCLFVSIFKSGVNVGMIFYTSQNILYWYGTVAYTQNTVAHTVQDLGAIKLYGRGNNSHVHKKTRRRVARLHIFRYGSEIAYGL